MISNILVNYFFYSGGMKNIDEKLPNWSVAGERSGKGLLIRLVRVCIVYESVLKKVRH